MEHAHILTDEELACLEHSGEYRYYYTMRQGFEAELCGFCVIDAAVNKEIFGTGHWRVFENSFPNGRPCKTMILITAKRHVRTLPELTRDEWTSLYDIMKWIEERYHLPGGMLFMRFGDMRLNAGTMPHLHWNLWVPDESKALSVPIFKDPSRREENKERAKEYSDKYEAGEVPPPKE